jgi:hypothetical protein
MSSNTWDLVRTITETLFYGLSAGAILWQRAAMSGGIHAKLDQLLGTQERQGKELTTVGRRLQALWRAVHTLRGRVKVVEDLTRPLSRKNDERIAP